MVALIHVGTVRVVFWLLLLLLLLLLVLLLSLI